MAAPDGRPSISGGVFGNAPGISGQRQQQHEKQEMKMKHETFDENSTVADDGDTADLKRCLWLVPMNSSTRAATVKSLSAIRSVSGVDGELPVLIVRKMIAAPSANLKTSLGGRATQVLSDCRRALRHWDNLPVRWLALRLRQGVPTFSDADMASSIQLSDDEAKRVSAALVSLAQAQASTLDELPATLAAVEPMLWAATPETFGVKTMKSLENKKTLVRKAVRLVDPLTSGLRETSIETLPEAWQEILVLLDIQLMDHEKSPRAILRRLACFCTRNGLSPAEIDTPSVEAFVAVELATHAQNYVEKLRAAFRGWNSLADNGHPVPRLPLPGAPVHRQAEVDWSSVPGGIRGPLDDLLETAVSVRNPGDWGAFVPDEDTEYAELGVVFQDAMPDAALKSALIIQPGTQANWRDAVKRAWHAASVDPRVQPKPISIGDLFCKRVIEALVASTRRARRDRMEAAGQIYDPTAKGSYEHTLVEALCSVGRLLEIAPERLEVVEELKRQLDPSVVGMKRTPDGGFKRVYAERRIGPRHAQMLAKFADTSRLKRWFEAPSVLWALACTPIWRGHKPRIDQVALARSALIARIGQYVAPVRRANHARLRHAGDDRHLILPEGDGEGTFIIPPVEGKTLREVHVRIDAETVRMLKYYIRHFLPVAQKHAKASPDNPHLFPGADGSAIDDGGYAKGRGYFTRTKLNNSFKKHLKKYCGLDLCLHVMRHLAGKVILDQDPSAMALVQEILGHFRLETTQSYYAEVSKILAQRRYLHLLERQSRQVLANVKFKFVDPRTGREISHA